MGIAHAVIKIIVGSSAQKFWGTGMGDFVCAK